jgi:hypothetical protein
MANDSNAVRVPDDLLQRLEADAIARLICPFTKASRALLVRAVLEQGLLVLEAQAKGKPGPPFVFSERPLSDDPRERSPSAPLPEQTPEQFRYTCEEAGRMYAQDEWNASQRRAGDGATDWFHKHESQLVEDLGLPSREKDPMAIDAAVIYAKKAFRAQMAALNATLEKKPREKRAPRRKKVSR